MKVPPHPPAELSSSDGDLTTTRDRLKTVLDAQDQQREASMKAGRDVRRDATTAMRLLHQGKTAEAAELLAPLKQTASQLSEQESQFRFIRDQLQEYAEGALLLALYQGQPLPTPEDLGISPQSWLLGLSDLIGEVRRMIMRMDPLHHSEAQQGWLSVMDELWSVINIFDHPDAILPIRSKQDQMRSIIEKTRSEVTLLASQARLTRLMQEKDSP